MEQAPNLDTLYAPPIEMIQKAVADRLIDCHLAYLQAATFFCFATGSEAGLDASPRAGPPGFVQALDSRKVAFADWPGNNRIESMRNLERDDRAGMLFLYPGLEIFMRINGHARLSTDTGLLDQLKEGERLPKVATVVSVEEVLFHCGKAINRANLWSATSHIEKQSLPSIGEMMVSLVQLDQASVSAVDAHYDHGVRHNLY